MARRSQTGPSAGSPPAHPVQRDGRLSLAAEGVVLERANAERTPFRLRELALEIAGGELVLLRGPSGCGKSTLLQALARLLPLNGGRLLLNGLPESAYGPPAWRVRVCYVAAGGAMTDGTVAENLRLPWRFRAARGKPLPSETALAEGLAAVGLEEVGPASDARSLSSGQTQRVALLRGMLLRPDFLLLDEPTANLDGKSARLVWEAITRFRAKSGAGVLCATHLRKAPAASRALIFKNGALTGENPK